MNIKDQIEALENTRRVKRDEMEEIVKRSTESGETMSAEDAQAFDDIEHEIKLLDNDLRRMKSLARLQSDNSESQKAQAREVKGETEKEGSDSRSIRVTAKPMHAEGGIAMAQVVRMLAMGRGVHSEAVRIAESKSGEVDSRIVPVLKAAVAAGTTSNAEWAGNLVSDEGGVYADFVEFLRPQTILGKFGTGNIPSLRRVPFRTPLRSQTAGADGYWVGEGKAKPLTKVAYGSTTLEPTKVANIAVLSEELIRASSPSADMLIRDELVNALRARLDADFINPAITATPGVRPASIGNGVTGTASSGGDADAVRADFKTLFGAFIAGNNAPTSGVFIMSAVNALALSMMYNPLGGREFDGLSMYGGTLFGLPVIVSEHIASTDIWLVNAQDIYLGDDGGFRVDYSREASLEMADNPAHDSDTPTPAELVSMFQTNSVAFRAERTISWKKRRADAVQRIHTADWGTVPAEVTP